MDGDGDGCGDFEGLARRLDYLDGLGIDALWLAPFQPSPLRDDGYDIADYYNVASRLGSSGDFVEFMRQAESRGIRVIIDLVVNHTSDRHPWFREARESRDAPKRDWYIWSKKRPPNWESGMVFPGVQKTTWTRDPKAREWYFHRFYDHEPDLNMQNPARARRAATDHGLLAPAGRGRVPDRCPAVRAREAYGRLEAVRARLRPAAPDPRHGAMEARRRRASGRSQRAPGSGGAVLRGGRRCPHDVQLLGQPAPICVARDGRCATAGAGPAPDALAAAGRTVGALPAQSRRARSWPSRRRCARGGVPRVRPATVDAALRSRHPATPGADARRPPAGRAGLQPALLASRYAGSSLRRRDRHGREPAPQGANGDPHAHAVVGALPGRLLSRRPHGSAGDPDAGSTPRRMSTSSSSGATPRRCCAGRAG